MFDSFSGQLTEVATIGEIWAQQVVGVLMVAMIVPVVLFLALANRYVTMKLSVLVEPSIFLSVALTLFLGVQVQRLSVAVKRYVAS